MSGNAVMEMLFLFLIVFFYNSDASFGRELRKLVGVDPEDNNNTGSSPLLTPAPGDNKSDPVPSNETLQVVVPKGSESTISPAPPPLAQSNNANVDPKGSSNSTPSAPPPNPMAESDDGKNHEIEKENEGVTTISLSDTDESCNDMSAKCKDEEDIVACISESGPKYLVILVQNEGDSTLKVNFYTDINLGDIEVPKHKTEKVNISLISSGSAQLSLNAGRGNCVLHPGTRVPQEKMFPQFASHDKFLTPINGAYFLILIVIVFGGTWACWGFRNKKQHDGVAYQQLEMAFPESVSATGLDNSEGWDQVWDDDWDEEEAVKSPGRPHAGSISADGLTSRSSNRDGWENNWDD
ncbi:uncharacterized protein G2W53_016578 [Senna tora]|uniref:DUF7356 domain-containing protein n=1 Tax=Senna tora TaxID=362788 RepID=A0A834TPM9_9FABA|nr:uncharacterized protein G2W53_016578 [Senna tora]